MSNYKDGAKAEFVVAEMLKSDGWHIAYASNLDGIAGGDGAPLVRGGDDRKIMPVRLKPMKRCCLICPGRKKWLRSMTGRTL